jgi:hypothetical protein
MRLFSGSVAASFFGSQGDVSKGRVSSALLWIAPCVDALGFFLIVGPSFADALVIMQQCFGCSIWHNADQAPKRRHVSRSDWALNKNDRAFPVVIMIEEFIDNSI